MVGTAVIAVMSAGCASGSSSSAKATTTAPPTTASGVTTTTASTATTVAATTGATIPGQLVGAGKIDAVIFTGGPADPTVTVNGSSLGVIPNPNPTFTPEGHDLCPVPPSGNQGFDYGVSFYLFNPARNWAGGRFRPELGELDCIGLLASSFNPNQVVFKFGSAYAQFQQSKNFVLAEGDPFQLIVNGAAFQGTVHYSG